MKAIKLQAIKILLFRIVGLIALAAVALGAKQPKADPSQKTDFSELSASFKIANGVAHSDDLKALSPFLRLGGAAGSVAEIGKKGVGGVTNAVRGLFKR